MSYLYKYKALTAVYLLLAIPVFITGCIVVKEKGAEERQPVINLSPKPEIPLSDELVRSESGDMIALLPEGWFFVDISDKVSANIFAAAVNPDYTLAAVFTKIKQDERTRQVVEREDTIGLARISMEVHMQKTGGNIKQIGKFNTVHMGLNTFVTYEYTTTGGALNTKAAVFISRLKNYYEFAIMPMNITGNPLPTKLEIEKIFRSVLTSIQY